ncbi:MAG: hypothetical protein ACI9SJ_000572 [Flavobacteriaceae bacterium]|uniref:hypothetical protein n=1 Tax=Candidatus Marifrigoribacter sp. Uisw_064 TaxID=3230970 RepID=UPI003AE9F2A0
MKYIYSLALLSCLVFWSSCRNDFESSPNTGNLSFSQDTVYLDTVFTNIGSSTRNIKVYNRSDDDIIIPTIRLEKGESSEYRLNVDGLPGKSFENIQILAKDSIFVFIETTINIDDFPNPTFDFLYEDKILFDTGGNQQDVDLVTLVQDAIFLFPQRFDDGTIETLNLGQDPNDPENDILIEGFILEDSELTFTNEKPYVIYGYAAVANGKTINFQPGSRVHFHENSGILVAAQATLKSLGLPSSDPELLENQIIFEGDRLEPSFSEIPGQWGALWLTGGSTNHEFEYTTIKNSSVGILMDGLDGTQSLSLKNVQIYNNSNYGLLARNSFVRGENVVINNSGQSSLACSFGGDYEFNHSTFTNYWTNGFRVFPTVQIDNFIQTGETTFEVNPMSAIFNNCIIYGNERREFNIFENTDEAFVFSFNNCLLKFEDVSGDFEEDENYNFEGPFYQGTVLNADPMFFNTSLNDFNIETGTSGADGIGDILISNQVPFDINGSSRSSLPDAGAYESVTFPED